ncbi:acylphosphatase [Microbacterium sp.]|uniref:acylphosphatase n=1 Tax=Microbacterium sp. TaxID=51671 RepID=UPI0039E5D74C
MKRVRVRVHGEVQAVGFRYTMQQVATTTGATGWVRNRADGTVEAEIEGTDAQVGDVLAWTARGPRGGRVDRVEQAEIAVEGSTTFEIRW